MNAAICLLFAYVVGSIPSAYYAGRIKGIDLRQYGSGNLGFTNAFRMLGAKLSIPVLIFDILKGAASVWFARYMTGGNEIIAIFAGLLAIIGHNWTIFLGFRGGGKGVAATAGVFLALTPVSFLCAAIVFIIVLATSRYMSLASLLFGIVLVIASAILVYLKYEFAPAMEVFIFSIITASLIVIRHHSNIKRLLNGTESKFGSFHKEDAS